MKPTRLKKDPAKAKSRTAQAMLTEDEYAQLADRAEHMSVSVSWLARQILIGAMAPIKTGENPGGGDTP